MCKKKNDAFETATMIKGSKGFLLGVFSDTTKESEIPNSVLDLFQADQTSVTKRPAAKNSKSVATVMKKPAAATCKVMPGKAVKKKQLAAKCKVMPRMYRLTWKQFVSKGLSLTSLILYTFPNLRKFKDSLLI